METIRLTVVQALLKFLDRQHLEADGQVYKCFKGVMGIFGHGNAVSFGEAFENGGYGLEFIQGKNEQAMCHAAIAYAKQKNRREMFACTASIGPGSLNMVTAAATATVNRIPLLLLPSDTFAGRQPDPVLQQIEAAADYTSTVNDCLKPASQYFDRIQRPEQLMNALIQAMRVLIDPAETGAVTLSLPQDVQCEAYDYPLSFFAPKTHLIERRPASELSLQRAVELIGRKKKPLILAGGGVHYSAASQELVRFAETFHIPVAETHAGKSAIPWNHPLNAGVLGHNGTLPANTLAREADLVIAVGTRLADFVTSSKAAFQNPEVELLAINVNSRDAVKMQAASLLADAKYALAALTDKLGRQAYRSEHDSARLGRLREAWEAEVRRQYAKIDSRGLTQTGAIGCINDFVGEQDIIVTAAGTLPADLCKLWRSKQKGTFHIEFGFSCMGYEIPGALGVKMAEPDREVYALVGDGTYLLLQSELVTSLQEGKKITVLLFDNQGYHAILGLQKSQGEQGFGNEFRYRDPKTRSLTGGTMPIDFAANARSLGAAAYTATTTDELKAALEQAVKEPVSTLIDIKVLPDTSAAVYGSWWRVGIPEISSNSEVAAAYEKMKFGVAQARPY